MHNKPHTEEARLKMSAARTGIPAHWNRRPTINNNGVTLYRCSTCKDYKHYEEFYKNKRTHLGIKSECKTCHIATSVRTRDKTRARNYNRVNARKLRAANPERFRARERSRTRPNDEKRKARNLLNRAVRRGSIIKPMICSVCQQSARLTAHHDNYSEPQNVEWLCYECHGVRHRKVYEFERTEAAL